MTHHESSSSPSFITIVSALLTVAKIIARHSARRVVIVTLLNACNHHITDINALLSHLISSELSALWLVAATMNWVIYCKATQFTVAATNQKRLTGWNPVFAISQVSPLTHCELLCSDWLQPQGTGLLHIY